MHSWFLSTLIVDSRLCTGLHPSPGISRQKPIITFQGIKLEQIADIGTNRISLRGENEFEPHPVRIDWILQYPGTTNNYQNNALEDCRSYCKIQLVTFKMLQNTCNYCLHLTHTMIRTGSDSLAMFFHCLDLILPSWDRLNLAI